MSRHELDYVQKGKHYRSAIEAEKIGTAEQELFLWVKGFRECYKFEYHVLQQPTGSIVLYRIQHHRRDGSITGTILDYPNLQIFLKELLSDTGRDRKNPLYVLRQQLLAKSMLTPPTNPPTPNQEKP